MLVGGAYLRMCLTVLNAYVVESTRRDPQSPLFLVTAEHCGYDYNIGKTYGPSRYIRFVLTRLMQRKMR